MLDSLRYRVLERVILQLSSQGWRLGSAESCTGGLFAALCTEMAGSSAWFQGGVVAYSNTVKTTLLHVSDPLIERYGAVSREVAEKMAEGCCTALGAHVGVAITGIAGPGGGTAQKPIGTVWIATAIVHGSFFLIGSQLFLFNGTRQDIRGASVQTALKMVDSALAAL